MSIDRIREKVEGLLLENNRESWYHDKGAAYFIMQSAMDLTDCHGKVNSVKRAGLWLLPDFVRLFIGPCEVLARWLMSRAYACGIGGVVRVGQQWMDMDCNLYSGILSERAAGDMAASNIGCRFCVECESCIDCTYCINSSSCHGAFAVERCVGMVDCVKCLDCQICHRCTDCIGCSDIKDQTGKAGIDGNREELWH